MKQPQTPSSPSTAQYQSIPQNTQQYTQNTQQYPQNTQPSYNENTQQYPQNTQPSYPPNNAQYYQNTQPSYPPNNAQYTQKNNPVQYSRNRHSKRAHGKVTCGDWCYPIVLLLLILLLGSGLSTIFVMDKRQAYVGGTFLFIFLILLLCSMGGWCFPDTYYYAPMGGYWGPTSPYSYYPMDPFGSNMMVDDQTTIINNNNNDNDNDSYNNMGDGGGGAAGDGGGGGP